MHMHIGCIRGFRQPTCSVSYVLVPVYIQMYDKNNIIIAFCLQEELIRNRKSKINNSYY